jgi:hypothetical protein
MNSLLKNVKSERTPILKKYISLPILLSPERDEELAKLTEQVKYPSPFVIFIVLCLKVEFPRRHKS